MLIKTREESLEKEQLEVLMRRLPEWHAARPAVEKDLYMLKAGIGGEERFDYYIQKSTPKFPYFILHDLSLKSVFGFQLDSVLITPWNIIVFEVKNLSGRTEFRHSPMQMIQTKEDGTVVGGKSPIEQMETNEWLFDEWLRSRSWSVPIQSVLVFSYVKQIPENVPAGKPVLFSHQLPFFIANLKPETTLLNEADMKKLVRELLTAHTPYVHEPVCADLRFPLAVMRKGVWCKACGGIGMKREHGFWLCKCGEKDKRAHERTIRDWLVWSGKPITNKLAQELLEVQNVRLVSRLLTSMELKAEGAFRSRKYRLKK